MEPLRGPLADLVAAETEAVAPDADAAERHWAAVAAAFGPVIPPPVGGAPVAEPVTATATATATAAKGGALLKIVGGTLAAGAIATGLWATRDPAPPVAATPTIASAPAPVREPVVEAAPDPTPTPAPPPEAEPDIVPDPPAASAPASAPAPRPVRRPAPAVESTPEVGLAEELALVEKLRRAVTSGDHARALALAREHRDTFPEGALRPDRLDLEATATCASGKLEAGRALADELARRWPKAPRSDRLETTCKLD